MVAAVTADVRSHLEKLQQPSSRDFLRLLDFSVVEIQELLALATTLKRLKKQGEAHRVLDGKSVAMYFEKPSNRTRVSFEVGIFDLGAHPIMLRKEEINLGVRETIADTARTLSRYVNGIMIRTFAQSDVQELAHWSTVPVINGLTDEHHPCQVLADLLTVKEHFGNLNGRKLTFIGDGNNMAHSLMEGCVLSGMDVTIACPSTHAPLPSILSEVRALAAKTGSKVEVTENVFESTRGASVVYTDVWASMGQEAEAEQRRQMFKDFQVNAHGLSHAEPGAIVLHCLPAHRGEEIEAAVFEKHADTIFEQAENRLHAQKAIMAALMG
jgi:ornithine carbamoyltransferase